MLPNIVTGTVTGTGADLNVALGFEPKRVIVHNVTDGTGFEWTDTMADAAGVAIAAAGDRTFTTTAGLTPYAGVPGPAALAGTVTVVAGSAAVAGSSTAFLSEVAVGDLIAIPGVGDTGLGGVATTGQMYGKVIAIASDTALTLQAVAEHSASGKTAYNTAGISAGFTLDSTTVVNGVGDTLHYIAERAM